MKRDIVVCIILNYNDAETTQTLVKHIYDYTILDYIIIVDNCSTDDSYSVLKKLESKKIHLIRSDINGGYGYGNNIGIKYAREKFQADYCVIANPDVIFESDIVSALYNFLDVNRNYALATGFVGPEKTGWKETGLICDVIFNSVILNKIFKPRYYNKNFFSKDICDVYAISGCFFLARMNALFDIGLYDEEFFLFEEEKVIAHKLKEKGWKTAVLTQCSYIHNHSVSIRKNVKKSAERKCLVLKSHELYLRKYKKIPLWKMRIIRIFYPLTIFEIIVYDFIKEKIGRCTRK